MNKKGNNLKRNLKNLLMFLVCIIFFICIIPITSAYADETKLIKTQNGTINIRQIGQDGPSVVFETGYGCPLISEENEDIWNGIQGVAAQYSKTIAYDRFGLGESSNIGNMPSLTLEGRKTILAGGDIKYKQNDFNGQYKTAQDKAINLHSLLNVSGLKKPYILVIHSIGSFTAIEFAKMYPNEVTAIIMLDGTFPKINQELYKFENYNITDFTNNFASEFTKADGTLDEILISGLQCQKDLKALNNIPMLYLQASETGMGKEMDQLWENGVSNMLSNCKFCKRLVVPNSTHYVYKCNPEFVNDEIKTFICGIIKK